ncbi:MAG TPA: ABC transporter permease [Terracidiphilus sp.]|jgi:lipopolysaccharide transport system permease protein|nr:ABC transporter permease [Terracidiphilus sp.]
MASSPELQNSAVAPIVVIRGADRSWRLHWDEIWQHRELLYFLTWRDIAVRYKQTAIGVVWAVLQPLAIALSLSLFLGRFVPVQPQELPYPLFAYSGMVVWQLFAQGLTESSNSVLASERLITKVYFPRVLVPMSAVLASLVDCGICLVILSVFLAYYRITPTASILALPVGIFLAALTAFGIGLWLSALNVKYRDVRYTLNFLIQFWFLATPIAYPSSIVPPRWRIWYELNPMVGPVEIVRWALRGTGVLPLHSLAVSICVAFVLFAGGLYYFQRTEDSFADFI